jgi:hypothetical protein
MTSIPYHAEITAYLADCAANRDILNPKYHPTAAGALKMIPHHQYKEPEAVNEAERQIRHAYAIATKETT